MLDRIPTYNVSLHPIPGKVLEKLDRIRRDFLWEGNNNKHKFHIVKRDKDILPKRQGGLCIQNLVLHNKCLLMKWLWRCTWEEQSFWKEIIITKHGALNHWRSKLLTEPYGVGVWKYMSKQWGEFSPFHHLAVGNGQRINIWKDKWLEISPLMSDFPNIFQIAVNLTQQYNRTGKGMRLRRNLQDWEWK